MSVKNLQEHLADTIRPFAATKFDVADMCLTAAINSISFDVSKEKR
jgi:hypothetical protein